MQIVTLTTDWGYGDYYMGVVKGRLYSTIADVQVVDITHNIRKYDNLSAAFVVKNACFEFPEGTIHIIDVNSYEETKDDDKRERNFVAIKHNLFLQPSIQFCILPYPSKLTNASCGFSPLGISSFNLSSL